MPNNAEVAGFMIHGFGFQSGLGRYFGFRDSGFRD